MGGKDNTMNLNISYLHPGQKAENTLKVLNAAKAKWPDDVVIQNMGAKLEKAAGELIGAYREWSTKQQTNEVRNADLERDNSLRYLVSSLKTITFDQSAEKADKAYMLLSDLFPNNLELISYPYPEESIHIKNILDKCAEVTTELNELNLGNCVDRLRKAQVAFDEVYETRSGHRENKPAIVSEKVKPLDKILRSFVLYLEATYDETDIRTVFDSLLRLKQVRNPKAILDNPEPTPEA